MKVRDLRAMLDKLPADMDDVVVYHRSVEGGRIHMDPLDVAFKGVLEFAPMNPIGLPTARYRDEAGRRTGFFMLNTKLADLVGTLPDKKEDWYGYQ